MGYTPTTGSNLWKDVDVGKHEASEEPPYPEVMYDEVANETMSTLEMNRRHAKDCLMFAQMRQERSYNRKHIPTEFEEGEEVLINPHSLELLKKITGTGKKLLPKFDGPFLITDKISPVTYRLNLSSNYEIHPVLNIEHLEKYHRSPPELGPRPTLPVMRDADKAPKEDVEVEKIVGERWRRRKGKRIHYYKVRWKGYSEADDSWKTLRDIAAPKLIKAWHEEQYKKSQGEK
jgi:hypothetical protein